MTHVIGQFEALLIAEANVSGTPLVNKTLRESNLRNMTGLTVLVTWERGVYRGADANRILTDNIGSAQAEERFLMYYPQGA
ncbi:MAG TPA: hypothetical protein VJO14_04885 [Bacteroidota bacterium]|nr:hypothetical protein [Bacteroidota bacterium]